MEMAVGIIRGAASTAIVSSLVDDPINPIIGLFTGGIDVTGLTVPLTDRPDGAAFAYGTFLMAVVSFLIVARPNKRKRAAPCGAALPSIRRWGRSGLRQRGPPTVEGCLNGGPRTLSRHLSPA
mgnify:FL=1